jgi:hypothetical protein
VANSAKTVRIWFENLATTRGDGEVLPLSQLEVEDHVHGGLRIELRGRLVPGLGFFGPDDVCFNNWLTELRAVAQAFQASSCGRHVFDEGEQGQPAFLFERAGDSAFFSISAGVGGGEANPDWERIEFSPEEFLAEHKQFCERFVSAIRAAAPEGAAQWIIENVPND